MSFLASREWTEMASVTRVYNLNSVLTIRLIKDYLVSKLKFRSE